MANRVWPATHVLRSYCGKKRVGSSKKVSRAAVGWAIKSIERVVVDVNRLPQLACPGAVWELTGHVGWDAVEGIQSDFLNPRF
jgi:hypothetical protein